MNTDTNTTNLAARSIDGRTFTAIASRHGVRERITVHRDGEVYDTRATTRVGQYHYVLLVKYDSTEPGQAAAFYAGKPKLPGSKHERGLVVAALPIQRVADTEEAPVAKTATETAAPCPTCGVIHTGPCGPSIDWDTTARSLQAAAQDVAEADARWRAAIVGADRTGLSHRRIAELAGCTHPTVAKILREERGEYQPSCGRAWNSKGKRYLCLEPKGHTGPHTAHDGTELAR